MSILVNGDAGAYRAISDKAAVVDRATPAQLMTGETTTIEVALADA